MGWRLRGMTTQYSCSMTSTRPQLCYYYWHLQLDRRQLLRCQRLLALLRMAG